VLFITSGAAKKHTPYWGAYAVSKAALESLALTYAAECEGTKLKVKLLSPGPMRTAMRKKAMPGEDPGTLPVPEDLTPRIVEMLSPAYGRNETIINFQK